MSDTKPQDPEHRMGVYKTLDAVPDDRRFVQFRSRYEGEDTWNDFVEATGDQFGSTHYRRTFNKAGRSWKAHVTTRDRHHSLARPEDVQAWCRNLTETRTLGTVYKEYFVRLEEFYTWLLYHVNHPHVYHPVLMAAAADPLTRTVWEQKFTDSTGGETDD